MDLLLQLRIYAKAKKPFTPANTNNANAIRIEFVYYTKRWVDQFTQKRLSEFRNNSTYLRMADKVFDLLKYFGNKTETDIRHTLLGVPITNIFKVADCGLSKSYLHKGRALCLLFKAKPLPGILQRQFRAVVEIG